VQQTSHRRWLAAFHNVQRTQVQPAAGTTLGFSCSMVVVDSGQETWQLLTDSSFVEIGIAMFAVVIRGWLSDEQIFVSTPCSVQ
jgi:hypothetical protein